MYRMGPNNPKPLSSKGSSGHLTPSPAKPDLSTSPLLSVISASAKAILEPRDSPTTPSSFTIFETPVFNPGNLSMPPAERRSSLKARNNIKRAFHAEKSNSERPGAAYGDHHSKKKVKTQVDEKILIGHHYKEPRLPVFALENSNGQLHIYANRKAVADPEIKRKWNDLVQINDMVPNESVILDKNIFSSFGEVKDLNTVKKLQLIREYLNKKKMAGL
jgi:hypothetical protein